MPSERVVKVLKTKDSKQDQSNPKDTALSEAADFEIKVWDKPPKSIRRYVVERVMLLGVLITLYFIWVGYWLIGIAALLGILIYLHLMRLEARKIPFQINRYGVIVDKNTIIWEKLASFWVCERDGFFILYLELKDEYPGIVAVVMDDFVDTLAVVSKLGNILEYKRIPKQGFWHRFTYGRYLYPHEVGLDMIK